MHNYEHKTIKVRGRFSKDRELTNLDRIINDSAANGWELISTTAIASHFWDAQGKTSAILVTFRRANPDMV